VDARLLTVAAGVSDLQIYGASQSLAGSGGYPQLSQQSAGEGRGKHKLQAGDRCCECNFHATCVHVTGVDIAQAFYLLSDCERDYLKEQLAKEVNNSSAAVTAVAAAPAMHQLHILQIYLVTSKKAVHSSSCGASANYSGSSCSNSSSSRPTTKVAASMISMHNIHICTWCLMS
jgi:hypothetical protein